jgi:hypothetical protein
MTGTKEAIEELTDRIYGIADLLTLLAELDEGTPIKPRTISCAGRIIADDIARLGSFLADLTISGADPDRG